MESGLHYKKWRWEKTGFVSSHHGQLFFINAARFRLPGGEMICHRKSDHGAKPRVNLDELA